MGQLGLLEIKSSSILSWLLPVLMSRSMSYRFGLMTSVESMPHSDVTLKVFEYSSTGYSPPTLVMRIVSSSSTV